MPPQFFSNQIYMLNKFSNCSIVLNYINFYSVGIKCNLWENLQEAISKQCYLE